MKFQKNDFHNRFSNMRGERTLCEGYLDKKTIKMVTVVFYPRGIAPMKLRSSSNSKRNPVDELQVA